MDTNQMNMMFSMMDSNGDQKLSWAEVFAFAQANSSQNGVRGALSFATSTDEINTIFASFDVNNDGQLSFAEFKAFIAYAYFSNPADGYVNMLMDAWDKNGDRQISWSELYNARQ